MFSENQDIAYRPPLYSLSLLADGYNTHTASYTEDLLSPNETGLTFRNSEELKLWISKVAIP